MPDENRRPGQVHGTTDISAFSEAPVPLHEAERLTEGGKTAHIQLEGHVYVLRITRAGKLILTK